MPVLVHCEICNKEKQVLPYRAKTFRFCSFACRSKWRSLYWTGENNPLWQGGERTKVCGYCQKQYSIRPDQPITHFRRQKFCTKECADRGGIRHSGEANWKWKGGHAKRSNRQSKWARLVISRDGAQCVRCGAKGVELHAHHLKSFNDHPELRWDVSNGETLCCYCHWDEHSAPDVNGVNSGKPLTDNAEGNPEPSPSGNIREGLTTRGRVYRRWEGHCEECGKFLSKRLSDVIGKAHHSCSKSCAMKIKRRNMTYRPVKTPTAHDSKASTSAPPERDDIVWTALKDAEAAA